MMFAEIL